MSAVLAPLDHIFPRKDLDDIFMMEHLNTVKTSITLTSELWAPLSSRMKIDWIFVLIIEYLEPWPR